MRAVTLEQLRADARLYSDQRVADGTNAFITDTELDRLINQQISELYDLLIAARGQDYYATNDTLAITAGNSAVDLPDDFYQLQAVVIEWAADDVEPVPALNHQTEIWSFAGDIWARETRKAYRVANQQITFYPEPSTNCTARLYYVPAFTALVDDDDEFDGVNGWEKLVALGVAIEMLEIEEAGTGARLQAVYDRQLERISQLRFDRDAAAEVEIRDVYSTPRHRYPPPTGAL